jgi:hypothetical protein
VPIVEVCVEVFFLVLFTLMLFLALGAVNQSSVVSSFLGRGVATLVGGCERIVFVGRVNVCFGERVPFAVCGPPGLREDTQLSQSSPLVIQSLSGVPEALSR